MIGDERSKRLREQRSLDLDEMARTHGFTDDSEMCRLVSSIGLSDQVDEDEFLRWRDGDGTKAGLLGLLKDSEQD